MGAKRAVAGKPAFSRRRVNTGLQVMSIAKAADNSGAKEVMIIGVPGYHGRLRRVPPAGVGDLVVVSVKKGIPEMRKKVFKAIVVRQRRPYKRPDGTWVAFEDNAVVILTPEGTPKGTEIRGPIAREAAERWPQIANLASMIV
ncbi:MULTISPECIES: 50S ribosomal protein L14 [Desulfurococcus]|jgi:large subunit ribosomal protein L14|uniref:Large ribosomal subunit protein uL14 n=1 Tax=Desulfurococcus amylolyticus (strain DSM 18924 / JCM 16383 / VKM B-2413 / 1221n) TaxID=490899 RepID=B8D5W0_DESA1|nr:50S ribosomal protein L14 [Desulfurococcus amylolyticus]ACL11491.1 50S ribosomal protein L14P [Desulfurococcus amylolyticus 1221n]